jgi:hypothetical protein
VFGFPALGAEKPNTNKTQVPQLASGVEGLPKAKSAERVSPVIDRYIRQSNKQKEDANAYRHSLGCAW